MKHIPLPREQFGGYTDLIEITHEDLTEATANTAQLIQALSLKAGDVVERVTTKLKTPFKDASDAAYNTTTCIVGDGGDDDRYLVSQELNENGTEILYKAGTGTRLAYTVDDTLDVIFGSMSAKSLSDIDTGKIHIYAEIVRLGNA